jgi:hypothetical protein
MTKLITIKSDGIYAHERNTEEGDYSLVNIKDTGKSISCYLNYFVNIDNNVTIENLMDILMQFEDDIDFLFMGYTNSMPLRPYYEQMKLEVEKPSNIEFVEICWGTDYLDMGEDFPPDLILAPDFVGVCENTAEDENTISPYYTMSVAPLNEWKHVPIRIDRVVEFVNYISMPGEKPKFEVLLYGNQDWHLHQFLVAFLQEITVHGSPKEKEKYMEDLLKFRDEAVQNGNSVIIMDDGEDWTLDVVEMFDEKELKRKLKEHVANDEFEEAQKIKEKLDELKKKKDEGKK